MGQQETNRHIESILKALTIIECFNRQQPEWSLKDLSRATGIPKSGILRICGTLESRGFVRRDSSGNFQLGPMFLTCGKIYEDTNNLISITRPIILTLSQVTGESASLFVRQGFKRVCLVCENGPSLVRFTYDEGQVLELTAGAGGKVLMAYAERSFRRQVWAQSRNGNLRSKELDDLEHEAEVVCKQGYAMSIGEKIPEAAAVAAPIFNSQNQVFATLTVAGPSQRFTSEHCNNLLAHLREAAGKLSGLLGYSQANYFLKQGG